MVGRGTKTIWTLDPKTEAIASDLSNFQREPGQATVSVSFPSSARGSPAMQEMQKTNGGLGGERHAETGTRSLSERL